MDKRYRVWCKNKNEWEKDPVVLLPSGELYDLKNHMALRPDTHIVEHSTGLLSAKSYRGDGEDARLVFEGDVCEDEQGGPFVIEFINTPQFYGLAMKYLTDGELMHLEEFSPTTDLIISTIYEYGHPELLENRSGGI